MTPGFVRGIADFIHETLNLDKDACRKIRRLFLFFFAGGALLSATVLAVSHGSEMSVFIVLAMLFGFVILFGILVFYVKVIEDLAWPWVPFSHMSKKDKTILLASFCPLFAFCGIVFGICAYYLFFGLCGD